MGERDQDYTDIYLRHVCGACWSQVGLTSIVLLGEVLCLATARPALPGTDLCMGSLTFYDCQDYFKWHMFFAPFSSLDMSVCHAREAV